MTSARRWPTERARMSLPPPGGNGTIRRNGLVGNSCAAAMLGSTPTAKMAAQILTVRTLFLFSLRRGSASGCHAAYYIHCVPKRLNIHLHEQETRHAIVRQNE